MSKRRTSCDGKTTSLPSLPSYSVVLPSRCENSYMHFAPSYSEGPSTFRSGVCLLLTSVTPGYSLWWCLILEPSNHDYERSRRIARRVIAVALPCCNWSGPSRRSSAWLCSGGTQPACHESWHRRPRGSGTCPGLRHCEAYFRRTTYLADGLTSRVFFHVSCQLYTAFVTCCDSSVRETAYYARCVGVVWRK